MKKSKSRILAIALAMMMGSVAFAATVPSDVVGKDYEEAVSALMDLKVITGDQDGLFHPDNVITRAQACVIVVKAMEAPTAEVAGTPTQSAPKSGFTDMNGYNWAEGYVNYAVKTGVTKGYGNGKFGPADKVSADQLITMILRGAGYTDKSLTGATWPNNYVAKAKEVGAYEGIAENMQRAAQATKWMAAQMTYNMLDEIKAADVEPPASNESDSAFTPGVTKMTFGTGSFNAAMTTYAGREIAANVNVLTYGVQKDYKADMVLPTKETDYKKDTIYKYRNATTPCFYTMSGGKITNMIIPVDAGFSGYVYGVINEVSNVTNGNKESVVAFDTLAAARPITWIGKQGVTAPANIYDGTIYELTTKNGEVQSVQTTTNKNGKAFAEISGNNFVKVDKYDNDVITIGSSMFSVKANAVVYVLAEDKKSYTVGSTSSIAAGRYVRAYDISDDKETAADLIVISKTN